MIEIYIPGRGVMQLHDVVCDVNGTLAFNGQLIDGVSEALKKIRRQLDLHLLTADTFGQQGTIDVILDLTAVRIEPGDESTAKADYVTKLGASRVVAIGQGANDVGMLQAAAVGICVLSPEGTSGEAIRAADIVMPDVLSALDLVLNPQRLVATLRR
jgi:P-type E1-E2 ATPase